VADWATPYRLSKKHKARPGHRDVYGKIENPDSVGSPTQVIDRLVREGDAVVAIGTGQGAYRLHVGFRFA
jgi:hypothetical protein